MTRLKLALAATLCLHCFALDDAMAAPIRFELWGEGSGNVHGSNFSGPFKITALGDTSKREIRVDIDTFTQKPFTSLWIGHESAEISLPSLGTFKYTTKTRTFSSPDFGFVGFGRGGPIGIDSADILNGPHNALPLIGWDMTTSTPEVSGARSSINNYPPVYTDGGELQLLSVGETLRFRATIIPEPATIAMAAVVLLGLAAFRQRS
jgi:hypothetical protein